MSVPIAGGQPTPLATAQNLPKDMAVDADNVYWFVASPKSIMTVPKAGGTPRVLASGQYVETGLVVRAATSTGTTRSVAR
jgi:hypothetical protein